jgi:putative intracellular protease/amidase
MKLYLYVLDTLADWEIGHLTAEIHSRRFFADRNVTVPIVKVGASLEEITTMGGMRIRPDLALNQLRLEDEDLLVLPGADTWFDPANRGILLVAKERIARDLPVAAICGATFGLASVGALDAKSHTSNDPGYLKAVARDYSGEARYLDLPAVSDRKLVTASGQSALDFSYEALKLLGVFKPATLEAWRGLYRTNRPEFFHAMMESLGS